MLYNKDWDRKTLSETGRLLLAAADLIEERGHAKKRFVGADGAMCFFGALQRCEKSSYPAHVYAAHALCAHLDMAPWMTSVVDWNDEPSRTKDEVVAAMRAAARTA